MRIFLDTANVIDVEDRLITKVISGVTTNPTLIRKNGEDPDVVYKKMMDTEIEDLSIEVKGDIADDLIANGIIYNRQFGQKATIKLPCTPHGIRACKILTSLNIRTNMTLVFSVEQAILCSLANATYVSPFVGRLDDIGEDGIALIADIAEVFCHNRSNTKILAASIRDPLKVGLAFAAGADICTLPPKVFDDMFKHELTDAGLKQFALDFGVNV